MSPSAAIKTSSPWDRNTFFASPGLLAKPKNLSVIGGGGGMLAEEHEGWHRFFASSVPFLGPFDGHRARHKNISSIARVLDLLAVVERIRSSVGSRRGSVTGTSFPEAVRRMFGFAGVAPADACDTGAADGRGPEGHSASSSSASPPNTASMITCFGFRFPVSLKHLNADNCAC